MDSNSVFKYIGLYCSGGISVFTIASIHSQYVTHVFCIGTGYREIRIDIYFSFVPIPLTEDYRVGNQFSLFFATVTCSCRSLATKIVDIFLARCINTFVYTALNRTPTTMRDIE